MQMSFLRDHRKRLGNIYLGKKALVYCRQMSFRISGKEVVPVRLKHNSASANLPNPAALQALACACRQASLSLFESIQDIQTCADDLPKGFLCRLSNKANTLQQGTTSYNQQSSSNVMLV